MQKRIWLLLIVRPKCTLAASHAVLVSHGEYIDGTDRQTDGQTLHRYITLSAMNAASVIIIMSVEMLSYCFVRVTQTDSVSV